MKLIGSFYSSHIIPIIHVRKKGKVRRDRNGIRELSHPSLIFLSFFSKNTKKYCSKKKTQKKEREKT